MWVLITTTPRTTSTKWIIDPDVATFLGPHNHGKEADGLQYIPLLTSSNSTPVDTIAEIDVDIYTLTRYAVNDYIFRRYLPTKAEIDTQKNMEPTGKVLTW